MTEMAQLPEQAVDLDKVVEHPKLLIFSRPRAGKTVFSCSDNGVLSINCEQSGIVAAQRSPTLGKNVKQWKVKRWNDFEAAVEWAEEVDRSGKMFPFRWLVVDTLSTLQDQILMRKILDDVHARKSTRSLYIPDKPEYLLNQQMLLDCVKRLNDLPVNVLYLAHVMEVDGPEGESFYYPQIQGGKFKVAQTILAQMTSYGYMYWEPRRNDKGQKLVDPKTKRLLRDVYIQWEDNEKMQGGDRLWTFPSKTKNLTLMQLRKMWEAENEKGKVNNGTD